MCSKQQQQSQEGLMFNSHALCFDTPAEEEGLQGVFKRLRRNGHQLEKGLQMAQRGPSLK
jgi:hypothetical protein